jgi:predicted transcriptional regulator
MHTFGVLSNDRPLGPAVPAEKSGKSVPTTATFKSHKHKLTIAMIDRLEKEVDMLERHLQVLRMVIENEPIGIVKMSNETGYPHHKVRYSLRVLEEENLIEPSSQGAITTEQTSEFVDDLDGKVDEIIDKLEGMKIEDAAEIEG